MRIQKYGLVDQELTAFGQLDQPDLFFQFYADPPYTDYCSMDPFALLMLWAVVPAHLDRAPESLVRYRSELRFRTFI